MTGFLARCFPALLLFSPTLIGAPGNQSTANATVASAALSNFGLGIAAYNQKNYAAAQQYLNAAQPALPRLADYAAYYIAASKAQLGDDAGAIAALAPIHSLSSPLAQQAALLEAKALIHLKSYPKAIDLLRTLPQPGSDSLLAQAYEGQGDLQQAAIVYQRIHYTRLLDAGPALERLKTAMGKDYPQPTPQQLQTRAQNDAAERDYHLGEAGLADLEKNYPESPWLLKSLVDLGNTYIKDHQPERAMPLFRAAAAKFAPSPVTALCHWHVAWQAYLDSAPDSAVLLKEQLSKYPDDQHAANALYFAGRLAQQSNDLASARAYFERLRTVFPHYYYGVLAFARLADPSLAQTAPSADTVRFLDQVKFPERREIALESPTPATLAHIERARLLIAAGCPALAEMEIRFGAATDGQRHVLALELAKSDPTLALSLRHMKVFNPEYLTLDYERAPKEVWGYLFPLPLQDDLAKVARNSDVDPYLVAGLIRQESEFNPVVVSRAHAFGLMQLLPSTGRLIARKDGIAPFTSSMLFDPVVNLKLGVSFLRTQLDRWNGNLEETLAAYNAGPARVQQWIAGAHFREPAEFVESIPFNETREYVQSVIRNAMVYRQLYSAGAPPPQPANALTSSHVSAPAPQRPVARKRAG